MDLSHLRESRSHGTRDFPVGVYEMERQTGHPLLETHWHEEAEFLVVEEGSARFRIGASEVELHAGEAVFVPGGELHGADLLDEAGPCTYKAIVFDLDWVAGAREGISSRFLQPLRRGRLALRLPLGRHTEGGRRVLARLDALLAPEALLDPAHELRFRGELLLAFADLWTYGEWSEPPAATAAEVRAAERLKETLAYIDSHLARKLTLGELAGVAGMSEGHFSRTFKSYMRKTPVDYINAMRLRRAAYLLAESGAGVSEAALEAGFDNFSYFSKQFRSLFQCSPSEYRRRARRREDGKTPSPPDGGKA